jgi:hypothetical protein
MTPSLDQRSAARILDLAGEAQRPRGPRSRGLAAFALILALAAHAAARSGFPSSAQTAAMSPAGARQASKAQAGESPEMKQLMAIGVAAAVSTGASAQDAVQWRVEDGGNGHWYAFKAESTVICWHDARALCELQGGHLASITSPAENQLLLSLTIPNNPGGVQGGPYIGGTCEGLPWGQWYWITGEPFSYTAWMSGAPNGSSGTTEQYLHFWRWSNLGWNDQIDCGGLMFSYLIEWSADCNSDGLVDYGQIRAGQLVDANGNNIPDCCENGGSCCPGDTNNDQSVDGIDLATVLTRWGMPGAKFPQADCNDDGAIDGTDLAIVLAGWGGCP